MAQRLYTASELHELLGPQFNSRLSQYEEDSWNKYSEKYIDYHGTQVMLKELVTKDRSFVYNLSRKFDYENPGLASAAQYALNKTAPPLNPNLSDILMPFGKRKGESLAAIFQDDAGKNYLAWVKKNTDNPSLKLALETMDLPELTSNKKRKTVSDAPDETAAATSAAASAVAGDCC